MFKKSAKSATPPAPVTMTVSDAGPCQKSLRLHVAKEAVDPVRGEILVEFQRQAALPGFRKGKAPTELVQRQYAKEIQDETLHRVARQAFERAVKEHGLKVVGAFAVSRMEFAEAGALAIEATVEVEPAFPLGSYKGIPLTRQSAEVTAEDLAKALTALQESMAQLVPAGEGQAKERKLPPIDDELAKDVGFENLEKLKAQVEAKLREQKRSTAESVVESSLCDELLTRHAFEVPPQLVGRQTDRLTKDFTTRLVLSGIPEEQVKERVSQFTEQLRTSAARHVKLAFILDRIAEQESVAVAQDEVVARLWQVAQRWKKDPAEVRKIFDANGLWPSVISAIRQEKTIAWLLSKAVINNGTAGEVKKQK
jgi:FKBP-type peptidyl-prolyl cis-trans isomerase (trigger factor)